MSSIKASPDLTEKDFQKIMLDLQQEKSWEAIIAKQEEILEKYGIDESYFMACVFPTLRDFASMLKNSKDQDPNEFFEERLRQCLGIEKEQEEPENLEQTERELTVKIKQAEKLGQYKTAFELQGLAIKKMQERIIQMQKRIIQMEQL